MSPGTAVNVDAFEPGVAASPLHCAVVLLSGGMDSAVTLAIARQRGYACHALSLDYGQRHAVELDAAREVALRLGALEHKVLKLDLRAFGGSALTADIAVPDHAAAEPGPLGAEAPGGHPDWIHTSAGAPHEEHIPVTYVPARNTIMLALALGWAEVLGARAIFVGVNAVDYSGYPDCRPQFIEAFERMAHLATRAGVEGHGIAIEAPLQLLSKSEIVAEGVRLGVDFAITVTCYQPNPKGLACGRCDACVLRSEGFAAAGVPDPTRYAAAAAVVPRDRTA